MDDFLADKIEGLKCAIIVEEAIMAGLQPAKDEWDKRSQENPPTGLQTRVVREWLSARGNAERFRKDLAMFETLAKPVDTLPLEAAIEASVAADYAGTWTPDLEQRIINAREAIQCR